MNVMQAIHTKRMHSNIDTSTNREQYLTRNRGGLAQEECVEPAVPRHQLWWSGFVIRREPVGAKQAIQGVLPLVQKSTPLVCSPSLPSALHMHLISVQVTLS